VNSLLRGQQRASTIPSFWLHLSAAWQVHSGQLKNSILLGAYVELPPLCDDLGNAANHHVAELRVVASSKWSYRYQLVDTLDDSADCRCQLAINEESAMTPVAAAPPRVYAAAQKQLKHAAATSQALSDPGDKEAMRRGGG